jgi:hypothetical protein
LIELVFRHCQILSGWQAPTTRGKPSNQSDLS